MTPLERCSFDFRSDDGHGNITVRRCVATAWTQYGGTKLLFTDDGAAWSPRHFGAQRFIRSPEHDRQLDTEDTPIERRPLASRDPHTPL